MRRSMGLRQNLKKFSKKSVDVGKFVKDIYVNNGLAYISCNVKGYEDIIDAYSVEGYEWLNGEFTRFLEENATYVPNEYPIVLEICGCKFRRKERECIEATIADYYALKMGDVQMSIARLGKKMWFLGGISFIFALIMLFMQYIPNLIRPLAEAPIVLFWFSLWDLAECAIFDRSDLMEAKLSAAQLASIKVTFSETFEDTAVEPEVEQQILEEVFGEDIIVPSNQWE